MLITVRVTFICSKTDDISLVEAQDSLGLEEEMTDGWGKMDVFSTQWKSLKKELEELRELKATYGEIMGDVDEQLESWEALRDQIEDGKTVYAPFQSKKRTNSSTGRQRKKQKRSSDDDEKDDDYIESSENSVDEDKDAVEDEPAEWSSGFPLTEEAVTDKVTELRDTKKQARRQRSEIDHKISSLREQLAQAKEGEKKIEAELQHLCIAGRNSYSKGAIQEDFAQGIKELDQEIAAEEDEAKFDPETEARDYEEVARSLPVFCVSSRGYQKLKGRLRKDPTVPGFKTVEETQIPQLQDHCQKLTVAGRTTSCKRFMTNLSQLFNSMTLWASSDGNGSTMTEAQRAVEDKVLQSNLRKLETVSHL